MFICSVIVSIIYVFILDFGCLDLSSGMPGNFGLNARHSVSILFSSRENWLYFCQVVRRMEDYFDSVNNWDDSRSISDLPSLLDLFLCQSQLKISKVSSFPWLALLFNFWFSSMILLHKSLISFLTSYGFLLGFSGSHTALYF